MNRRPWELPSAEVLNVLKANRGTIHGGGRTLGSISWVGNPSPHSAIQQSDGRAALLDAIARFRAANPITTLIETYLAGAQLARACSTNGGEWEGPCPRCGGTDRLRVWPTPRDGSPRAWCRQCDAHGDALDWAMIMAGLDPRQPGAIAKMLRDCGYLRDAAPDLRAQLIAEPASVVRMDQAERMVGESGSAPSPEVASGVASTPGGRGGGPDAGGARNRLDLGAEHPSPCYCCGSREFWALAHVLHWVCARCHQPDRAPNELRWIHVSGSQTSSLGGAR